MDGSIFRGGVSIGLKLAALTLPLVVYVMTQAIDDYKTEVDENGLAGMVHEESADGSGEVSGVAEDANDTEEVPVGSGLPQGNGTTEDETPEAFGDGSTSDSGSDSNNTDGALIDDDIGSVDDGILGGSGNSIVVNWLTFESTAYIALCDTGCTGITATGVDVRSSIYHEGDRVIAVDPAVIPLGSRVEIRLADGATFTARAIDTGGAINGHIIDLLVATEAEAWAFGRQSVELRILGE